MKVDGITIKNFKGIEDMTHRFNNKVTVLSGHVGAGKTSFMQAFRYGLTGETPTLPIHTGKSSSIITMDCGEEMCIERTIVPPNKKGIKILGRKVGVGASEEYISETTNVSNDIMKIVTSSEVLQALKPDELGTIFLEQSKEKWTMDDLLDCLTSLKIKEKTALDKAYEKLEDEDYEEGKLPAEVIKEIKGLFTSRAIDLDGINKAYDEAKATKRDRNAQYKISSSKSKGFLEIVKPAYTEHEIKDKLEEVIGVERNVASYKKTLTDYKKALQNKQEQDKRIATLELSISMNKGVKPDTAKYAEMLEKKEEYTKQIVSHEKILQSLNDSLSRLKKTIESLDKPVCPISGKLTCTTDKTCLCEELDEEAFATSESIIETQNLLSGIRNSLSAVEEEIENYQKNKEAYNKKVILRRQLDEELAHPVMLPDEPDKISIKSDYTTEKNELNEKLSDLRRYNDAESEYKKSLVLKRQCIISDFITKALEPKGPVIEKFLATFVEFLEISCNERSALLKTGLETKFSAENGLKVLFKTGEGKAFLPYSNLSAGEKIFALILLTDLINSFCDSRVLIIDDTDHLDKDCFDMLLNFLTSEEVNELYDNIIISCVHHDDLERVIDRYEKEALVERIKF